MANYEVDVFEMVNCKFNVLENDIIEPFLGWQIADHVLESYNLNYPKTQKNPKDMVVNKFKNDRHIKEPNIQTKKDNLYEDVLKTKTIHHDHMELRQTNEVENLIRLLECNTCHKMFITKSKIIRHFAKMHTSCFIDTKPSLRKTIDKNWVSSGKFVNSTESNFGDDKHINKSNIKTKKDKLNGLIFKQEMEIIDHEKFDSRLTKDVLSLTSSFECNACHKIFITKSKIIYHFAKTHRCCLAKPRSLLRKTIDKSPDSNRKCINSIESNFGDDKSNIKTERDIFNGHTLKTEIKTINNKQNDSGLTKKHERVHTGEKPFKCSVCEKDFSRHDNFKRHERVHTGEKQFKCDVCKRLFAHSESLKLHKRVHTGEKPFNCSVCEKSFSTTNNLKIHNRVHTDARPYVCNVCKKTFRTYQNRKAHNFLHTGERPFKCDVCKKSFNQKQNLKRHQKVHTDKEYKCGKCKKSYNRRSYLKSHQAKTKH